MKKTIKKLLASLLVAVMVLTAAPLSGFVGLKLNLDWLNFDWLDFSTKSSALEASGSCGENVTYTFNSSTGALVISGIGKMKNYVNHDSPFRYNNSIKNVIINKGITSIGDLAFCGCTGLTSITIPDSVTSIGNYAFYCCTGLTSVTIPNSVTSIGNYAFYDTGYYNNKSNWNNNVLYIGNYLIRADQSISGRYTVKSGTRLIADNAFSGCTGLTSVTIPNSITSIGSSAFSGCTGLTNITIPNNVTNIGDHAFINCTGLTNITIPNSVTSIENWAFAYSGLTNITIPNSVTSIGESAFCTCTGLTNITIPNSVTSIGVSAFSGCTGLTNITIPSSVTRIGVSAFYNCTGLTNITIPDSVTRIGDRAFFNCIGLTNITIPNSVTSIDDYAFYGCSKLKDVYYTGTEEQWNKIKISSNNEYLTRVTIHFNQPGQGDDPNEDETKKDVFSPIQNTNNFYFGYDSSDLIINMSETSTFTIDFVFSTYSDEWENRIYYQIEGPDGGLVQKGKYRNNEEYSSYNAETGLYVILVNIDFQALKVGEYVLTFMSPFADESSQKKIRVVDINYSSYIDDSSLCRYNFKNNTVSTEEYIFKAMYGDVRGKLWYDWNFRKMREGAYCFGMSVSTAIYCQHKAMIFDFSNEGKPCLNQWVLEKDSWSDFYNVEAETWIKAVQISQAANNVPIKYKNNIDKILSEFYSNKNLLPILFEKKENGKEIKHCVLATGIINGLDDNWINISIYDPNEPEGTYILKVSKDKKIWKLIASFDYSSNNGDSISCLTQEGLDEIYNCRYNFQDIPQTRSASSNNYLSESSLLVISDSKLNNSGLTEIETPACGTEISSDSFDGFAYWAEENMNKFDFTATENTTVSVLDVNRGLKANIPSGSDVNIKVDEDNDDYIEMNFSANNNVDITLIEAVGDVIRETKIEGESSDNNVLIKNNGENIDVSGMSKGTVTVVEEDKVVQSVKINDDDGMLTIKYDNNHIVIENNDKPKVKSVSLGNDFSLNYKSSAKLNPVIKADSGVKYTTEYKSSNNKVATVDENGKVYAAKKGNATITCTVTDEYGNTVSDTCTVNVKYTWWQWIIKIVLFGWIWY